MSLHKLVIGDLYQLTGPTIYSTIKPLISNHYDNVAKDVIIFRSRDYDGLVELSAKIGVKIRERDEGSGNKVKVRTVYMGMQHSKYF